MHHSVGDSMTAAAGRKVSALRGGDVTLFAAAVAFLSATGTGSTPCPT
jgi:hypothetical protein